MMTVRRLTVTITFPEFANTDKKDLDHLKQQVGLDASFQDAITGFTKNAWVLSFQQRSRKKVTVIYAKTTPLPASTNLKIKQCPAARTKIYCKQTLWSSVIQKDQELYRHWILLPSTILAQIPRTLNTMEFIIISPNFFRFSKEKHICPRHREILAGWQCLEPAFMTVLASW